MQTVVIGRNSERVGIVIRSLMAAHYNPIRCLVPETSLEALESLAQYPDSPCVVIIRDALPAPETYKFLEAAKQKAHKKVVAVVEQEDHYIFALLRKTGADRTLLFSQDLPRVLPGILREIGHIPSKKKTPRPKGKRFLLRPVSTGFSPEEAAELRATFESLPLQGDAEELRKLLLAANEVPRSVKDLALSLGNSPARVRRAFGRLRMRAMDHDERLVRCVTSKPRIGYLVKFS